MHQPAARSSFILLTLVVVLQVAGGLLHGAPTNPDIDLQPKKIIGTFLTFLFFSICVMVWGNVLRQVLRIGGPAFLVSASLGLAGAAFVAMLLGYAGLIGFRYQWLMNLSLLSGVFLFCLGNAKGWFKAESASESSTPAPRRHTLGEVSVWVVCAAIVVSLLALGAFPLGGSDDLRYHLVGPRLWSDAGRIFMTVQIPAAMQSSYWEYLFLWGNGLVTGPGVSGLIEGQLFAQWTHTLWGLGGTGLALSYLLRPLVKNGVWVAVAVAVAFCAPSLLLFARVAKNDWGVVFWLLAATALLLNNASTLAAGVLLGVAAGAKPTAAFYIVPLVLVWAVVDRKNWRELGVLCAAALAGFLPQALHWYVHTGNPVYPALNDWFQSPWLGPSLEQSYSLYDSEGPFAQGIGSWLRKFKELWLEVPTISALAAIPLWRSRNAAALKLVGVGLLGFLLFSAFIGPEHGSAEDLRLYGPGLILLAAVSVVTVEYLCERLGPALQKAAAAALAVSILAFTLAQAKVPWGIWLDALNDRLPPSTVMIRSLHLGGYAKSRIRMAADRDDIIFTSGDNQLYYLAQFNVIAVPEHSELDRRTSGVNDPLETLNILREFEGRYLIDTRRWDVFYWGPFAKGIGPLLFRHPEALKVATRSSDVYDLRALENAVYKACVYTKPHPLARVLLGVPEHRPAPKWWRRR